MLASINLNEPPQLSECSLIPRTSCKLDNPQVTYTYVYTYNERNNYETFAHTGGNRRGESARRSASGYPCAYKGDAEEGLSRG